MCRHHEYIKLFKIIIHTHIHLYTAHHCQSLPQNNITVKSLLKFSKILEVCVETNAYKPKHTYDTHALC
jgi:hypothetical protein